VLTLVREGRIIRYRCHTGHAYSADSLLMSTSEQTESRLWGAVRALDETILLLNSMGHEFAKAGNTQVAEAFVDQARAAHERAQPIREAAAASEALSTDELRNGGEAPKKEKAG
jgi:two-component system chemotaxis response regulator CheB